jgi:hypothetical protein
MNELLDEIKNTPAPKRKRVRKSVDQKLGDLIASVYAAITKKIQEKQHLNTVLDEIFQQLEPLEELKALYLKGKQEYE